MIEILTESGYIYLQLLYLVVWVHIHHAIYIYASAIHVAVFQSHAI